MHTAVQPFHTAEMLYAATMVAAPHHGRGSHITKTSNRKDEVAASQHYPRKSLECVSIVQILSPSSATALSRPER